MARSDVVFSGMVVGGYNDWIVIEPATTWKGPEASEQMAHDGTMMGEIWLVPGNNASRTNAFAPLVHDWYEGEEYLVYARLIEVDDPVLTNYILVWSDERTSATKCASYDLVMLQLLWSAWRWPVLATSTLMLVAMVGLAWRHRAQGPANGG